MHCVSFLVGKGGSLSRCFSWWASGHVVLNKIFLSKRISAKMPIDFSSALEPYTATRLALTFNTNIAFYTQAEFNDFTEEMRQLFLHDIEPYTEEIFGIEELVPKVKFEHFGVEAGNKFHRGHVHFIAEIKHKVPRYSAEKLTRRFVAVLNKIYPRSKGWHGHFEREGTGNANYSNKYARHENESIIEDDPEYAEEIERLSDPRKMYTVVVNGKTVRKLGYSMEEVLKSLEDIRLDQ
jgi:hypothetical protein